MKPHEVNEIDTTLAASTNGVIKLTMAEIFEGSRAEGRYLLSIWVRRWRFLMGSKGV